MKKILMVVLVLSVLTIIPAAVSGMGKGASKVASTESVEGSIQGYQCVVTGTTCPVGMEDPMAAIEDVFVLLESGKTKKYYFVPNVDRTVLARHINERVKISGKMSDQFNSITAEQIDAFEGGKWKTVWKKDWEDKLKRSLSP